MRFRLPEPARYVAPISVLAALALGLGSCDNGEGTEPPPDRFNFPVGLAVPPSGDRLYVANSNFDLQWNGGTLQAYDLITVRNHVFDMLKSPAGFNAAHPDFLVDPNGLALCTPPDKSDQPTAPPQGSAQTLGAQCIAAVHAEKYIRASATIGAFATDLQLSRSGTRLFAPVRGDASLTWADVSGDRIDCGQGSGERCDAAHRAGNDPNENHNSRHITLPGEPFGMAQSEDGEFALITHQTDTKTSLFLTGITGGGQLGNTPVSTEQPSLQFVVDGVSTGGVGIAPIPHDNDAWTVCQADQAPPLGPASAECGRVRPRPAFIQASRSTAKVDLLRLYIDQGYRPDGQTVDSDKDPTTSTPYRPYLQREAQFDVIANAGNFDSRGLAIDDSARRACKLSLPAGATAEQREQCARLPARIYIANRAPASLLIGELGEENADGSYDPDRLTIRTSLSLTSGVAAGPSRVYLAPVIETDPKTKDLSLGLRVFVVCFDSSIIFVYDPSSNTLENIIHVDDGPFAMAFDPFNIDDVARHATVEKVVEVGKDNVSRDQYFVHDANGKRRDAPYRFGYVAIFRNSHAQVIDLLNAPTPGTFFTYEKVVFNLGEPIGPKGGL